MSKNAPSNRPTGRSRGRPARSASNRNLWAGEWLEAARAICADVGRGLSLAAACAKYQMIEPPMFLRWIEQHPAELRAEWERAKDARANGLFDEITDLANELIEITRSRPGNKPLDAGTRRACLVDAAKMKQWAAARLDPEQFGDRAQPGSGVAIQINTSLPIQGADPLNDGSGAFTVRVAPDAAIPARIDEGRDAGGQSAGDPSTP